MTEQETTAQRILREAAERDARVREQRRQASQEDYVYDKAQEKFWDIIDGTLHGPDAVDASIPLARWRVEVDEPPPRPEGEAPGRGRPRQRRERLIKPSIDIQRIENDLFVESSTWWPGHPRIIPNFIITGDGVRYSPGRRAFNTYEPPNEIESGLPEPTLWIEHIRKLWPDPREHEFFFDYCAHMIQRPEEKCNAAIVLSGKQGIGKDAALVPVKAAVGDWNCKNIDPDQLFSKYRPWLQSLMLVVDEVRPSLDDFHASSMYNILKPMIVAPPHTLPLEDKYARLRHVVNVLRVFITTNDWMAMYIPEEDRRMFVMHSNLEQKWFEGEGRPDYFAEYWDWVEGQGLAQVASWLQARDIREFNPKAQVVRTAGWEAVAGSWGSPDDAVAAALERLGSPEAFFAAELAAESFDDRDEIANMLKSPRKITHRMLKDGYSPVPCPNKSGRWGFKNTSTGKDHRFRLAFAKITTEHPIEWALGQLEQRGQAIAARGTQIRAVK